MKIKTDLDLCQGHGMCEDAAPEERATLRAAWEALTMHPARRLRHAGVVPLLCFGPKRPKQRRTIGTGVDAKVEVAVRACTRAERHVHVDPERRTHSGTRWPIASPTGRSS